MSTLEQILEGKLDPNEIVSTLIYDKNWTLLIDSLIQRIFSSEKHH